MTTTHGSGERRSRSPSRSGFSCSPVAAVGSSVVAIGRSLPGGEFGTLVRVGRYTITRIDDLDRVPVGGHGLLWRPVRRRLGIEAFGVNAYTCGAAGEEVVEPHDELGGGAGGHEELYVVLSGHAVFTLDGEEQDAPAGTLVFCKDPAVKRSAVAREAGTTVLAVGGARGEPYRVSPWESYFAAKPLLSG